MKNLNIFGVHGKIQVLGEGFKVLPQNEGAWTVCRFTGGGGGRAWQERGGGAFEMGVDTPMHTMRMLTGMGFNTLSAHFCD